MWTGGVRVIVQNNNDEILLVKQEHPERSVWMVPGGGIEDGESSIEAAIREVKEETGLDIEIERMLWFVEETGERGQRFVNFFLAKATEAIPKLGHDPEFDEAGQVMRELRFMSREKVAKLEHIYPEFLRDEIWDILESGNSNYNAYKEREKNPLTK